MPDAISLYYGNRGKKKSSSDLNKRFVLPPSYFKDKVISPPEKLDTSTTTEISIADNIVAKPASGIEKNEVPTAKTTVAATLPSETLAKLETQNPTEIANTEETQEVTIAHNEALIENKKAISETTTSTTPVIKVNRPERKVSGLSLKSIQLKQKMQRELQSQEPDTKNLPTDPFTEEALIAVWKEYTQLVQNDGKHILHSHLTMGEPRVEGDLIHLIFPNNTIKLEVEREQGELLGFIKKKLNNYNIDLSIEVDEVVAKKYAYSTREKFEKLNEKNPLLDKLRQTFDLDL